MSSYVLPVRTDGTAFYDFEIELEGKSYTFELRWNGRDGFWYLAVYDADGTIVVGGRRVVLGAPLLGGTVNPDAPPGEVFAIDTTGLDADPGAADLGSRVLLVYVDSSGV